MSARILSFTGQWQGSAWRHQPDTDENREAAAGRSALRTARLIWTAQQANSDWTARILTGLLASGILDREQMLKLEAALAQQVIADRSEESEQALALCGFANSDKKDRERIKAVLHRLQGGR